MTTTLQTEPLILSLVPTRKRSHSDMRNSRLPSKWIDEDHYRTRVLCLYPTMTEDDLDDSLRRDAQALGVSFDMIALVPQKSTSSVSATTASSEPKQESIMSQSTAPTSCSSSEYRLRHTVSACSSTVPANSGASALPSQVIKKKHSGFKGGILKMTGFAKRRSALIGSPSTSSLASTSPSSMRPSEDPGSARHSTQSMDTSRLSPTFLPKSSTSQVDLFSSQPTTDSEAHHRSIDCQSMQQVRARQTEESLRFTTYQKSILDKVRAERDRRKQERIEEHRREVADQEMLNEKAGEALEARQLEEELKIQTEHESEKRAIMTRLRYMEAYCQNPSPPPSPASPSEDGSIRGSVDSGAKRERQITQQHYENLAQQYHQRDTMDDLHASKINVLRGKQKRAVENFFRKKEREIEQMQAKQAKELETIDSECSQKEAEIKQEFGTKRQQLEARWRIQAILEHTRMEQTTGLKYEPLPAVTVVESQA